MCMKGKQKQLSDIAADDNPREEEKNYGIYMEISRMTQKKLGIFPHEANCLMPAAHEKKNIMLLRLFFQLFLSNLA